MLKLTEKTIGDWLEYWADKTPDKDYIVYSDRNLRFTWSAFNERVDNMANGLISIGVTKGSIVGIWAENVPDWLTLLYATAKIGAISVTINTNYRTEELAFILENSDMQTLCMTAGKPGIDYIETIYSLFPEIKTVERGNLKSKRFPKFKNIVFMGQEKHRGMYNTNELLMLGRTTDKEQLINHKKQVSCYDTVNIQYTSGTTGFPKGVMLSHHNIVNNGYLSGLHMDFSPDDKLCLCVPLYHCFGVVLGVMCCLTHGSTQVMVEKFDALVTLASIDKEKCTVLYGVPTMFIAEINHPMFDLFDMSSLRTGIMAGALCPIELMREVSKKMYLKITSVYGMTEVSPGMTQSRIDDPEEVRYTTVGSDYEFTEVKVLNPKTGEECPVGVEGEMCCKGYNIMQGYYKNPEATSQVIDENGFMHSGDLGIKDENGNYRITGRIKDMIIRGGENISPKEIEDFLHKMPEIQDVQVVGIASPRYGEDVSVFIIPKKGETLTREDVRYFCKGRIAKYKIPRYVFFVEEYPMTGSGKVQKFKLKELALELAKKQGVTVF